MDVDKTLLLKLRKETLAPFSACAEALKTTSNNYQEAKKALFSKSILKAKSNLSILEDNALPEGRVLSINSSNHSLGLMFILRAQTDFVTTSADFKNTQAKIGDILLNYLENTSYDTPPSIEELLQLKDDKDNLTIENKILTLSSITKEQLQLKEIWIAPKDTSYITLSYQHHNFKLGALLTLKKNTDLSDQSLPELKKLIVHYAASENTFLREDQISEEWQQLERNKLRKALLFKNPKISNIEGIIDKQLKKTISEVTFSSQFFILDNSIKISDILSKYNLTPVWSAKVSL